MTGLLTVVAEEMGRVFGMVWSGVGVAVRLNNQVMTTVLKATTRIVQLLLLLTHKAADLLSIIFTDLLLFLGDIGNAAVAAVTAVQTAASTIYNFVSGLFFTITSAALYSCHLVQASYCTLLSGMMSAMMHLGNILTALKHFVILFGSSVMFIVSLIPNLICLVFSGLVHLWSYAYLSCSQTVSGIWLSVCCVVDLLSSSFVNFFNDIPLEALFGVVMGVVIIFGLKYALSYMMDNLVIVPDLTVPSVFVMMRQRFIRWYMGVVRRAHQRPPVENDTEEEELDDANDENGNDNNDNVPDLNLPQNQHFALQMNMPGPAQNQIVPDHLDDPIENGDVNPQNPVIAEPLVPHGLSRRPITRQRTQERLGALVPPVQEAFAEVKGGRESTSKLDSQAYQLYRELEEEREGHLCVVCQDQAKCVILLPCRHLCLCDACYSAIVKRDNICPVCRRPILEMLRVFV